MSEEKGERELAKLLGTDARTTGMIAPLLGDAASALSEVTVPSEHEIHDMVAGAYHFANTSSHESEDTDRKLADALKNVSGWRDRAQIYLNGASVLLRRAIPGLSRFDAKKRVLAGFRALHPGRASECFYFSRETAIDHPAEKAEPTDDQKSLVARLGTIPKGPRSDDTPSLIGSIAKLGDRIGPFLTDVLARPDEWAKKSKVETGELLIGIRRLLPKLPAAISDKLLRSALEAGWLEWIDRPLREAPIDATTREKLLSEFGTRQDARGNPYRPSEPWFYNLDAS